MPHSSAYLEMLLVWSAVRAFVGYMKRADGFTVLCPASIMSSMGNRNASVLPDAVGAVITTSLPEDIASNASSWYWYRDSMLLCTARSRSALRITSLMGLPNSGSTWGVRLS